MGSKVLANGILNHGRGVSNGIATSTTNNSTTDVLYDKINCLTNGGTIEVEDDESHDGRRHIFNGGLGLSKNYEIRKDLHQQQQNNAKKESHENIVYEVPCTKTKAYVCGQKQSDYESCDAESLIPSAAKLILNRRQDTRNDILDQESDAFDKFDFSGDEEDFSGDFLSDPDPDPVEDPPQYQASQQHQDYSTDDFGRDSFNDYGLEVIHEETESQMSCSDSETELDIYSDFYPLPPPSHSSSSKSQKDFEIMVDQIRDFEINKQSPEEMMMGLSAVSPTTPHNNISQINNSQQDNSTSSDEIVMKHIRISPDWDPEPILNRLYNIPEPQLNNKGLKKETTGFLSILSGNRKKGTFWNAWKSKFYVLVSGKLNGYEKDNCQDLFQTINLIGGKVDFLDPTDFVGTEQSKLMTNRIFGIDDGKGHYYVFQCQSATEAAKWIAALQAETTLLPGSTYATPILPKNLSVFRDIILIDFGSTNIRAGVLTHQPTLPALFFAAVSSENNEDGKVFYGNDVYLRDNRKNAKISFPIECTSKMCQNTLNMTAIKGFLLKIFKELNVKPENYRMIINLPRRVDGTCKKSMLQLLFNVFEVRSALLCHQSVVSFWAYSADNGIICDIGERCDIVPVSQGFVLSHAWGRAPFGGQPLKHALRQGLGPQENGLYLSTPAENLALRFITENFLYTNGISSRKMSQESQEIVVEMDLRDVLSFSSLIGVNQNVLRGVSEGFFDPGVYGLDCDSLQKLVFKSLQDCGMDIKKEMSQNIFLTGGCTMLPGFAERLEAEVTKLCPPHLKPKIQASPYRYHASYIGASVLATTDAFEKSLVQRIKYDGGPGPTHWLV